MKIGFDAKWFFTGNPSGRVVVKNMLKQLLSNYPEHDFYIFLKSNEKHLHFPYMAPNIHLVYVWGKINLLSNTIIIPIKSIFLKLDIFLFQYSAPPISSFKRVVYIYDVIFEDSPEFFSFWERLYFSPLKFLARRTNRICTISGSEKKRIVQHNYGSEAKVDVVYLGVDSQYKPKELQSLELLEKTEN